MVFRLWRPVMTGKAGACPRCTSSLSAKNPSCQRAFALKSSGRTECHPRQGNSDSNLGRRFRGHGVVVMILEAGVVADAVASPSSSPAAGSDVGAASAQPSSCADGRLPRCVTVISEWKAPSGPHLVWVLAVEGITIAQACGWRHRSMSAKSFREWLLEGQLYGRSPGQLPPRDPRSLSLTRATTFLLTRCVAAAKLELSDPLAAPHPCANPRCCPLPPGRSLVAVIITTTVTRRLAVVPTLWRLLPRRCTQGGRAGALPPRATCRAQVGARRPRLARRCYVVGCRRATWGGRRATWGGQRPVGPCTLVPSGTAEPSGAWWCGTGLSVVAVAGTPPRTCACSQV